MQHDNMTIPSGIEGLIGILVRSERTFDAGMIVRAYEFAARMHDGQFRDSGDPYITHPIAVAELTAELMPDTDAVCAALLHDTVEDCGATVEEISKLFNKQIAELVDGLTKLVQIPFDDKEDEHMENLRKMFLAMSRDIRVLFVKLCDRLHNMRTLGVRKDEKRRTTALETMHVYAPLAHRLGIQRIKQELELLALSYLDPVGYNEVSREIERRYGQNRAFLDRASEQIRVKMSETGIPFTMEGRVKSIYSIYHKMYDQNKTFDEIYDFYAIRIIVETELQCYVALGVIHDAFNNVPGRFKDYISTPKANNYRSLHTTVMSHNGIPFEVQIRTREMHQVAEYGLAAHWKYKSGDQSAGEIDDKLSWVSKLLESEEDVRDPDEFMRSLKIDIFQDEIFVFTPKGDLLTLPGGATVIDFAYAIHSAVGNKMVGAKINGLIVPIDRVPQNGDIIEILTSASSKGPSRDWLKLVRTGEARAKIRQWFKKERRAENILLGKTEIDRELRNYGGRLTEEQRAEILTHVAARVGIQSIDDLYNTVGYGGMTVSRLASKLRDEFDRVVRVTDETEEVQIKTTTIPSSKKGTGRVIVDGASGCEVKFARCCNPLPGDAIIGFVTVGHGISIHKAECPNVKRNFDSPAYSERWVAAMWEEGETQHSEFEAALVLATQDRVGMLADVTTAFAEMHISLLHLNTQQTDDGAILQVRISCKSLSHLQSVMAKLRSIRGVNSVERGYH